MVHSRLCRIKNVIINWCGGPIRSWGTKGKSPLNIQMLNPTSWHIEPTSRCTLECPGCDRTWYRNTFSKQIIQDIDVTALTNFFSVNNFLGSQIRLCGNNGDPIYHPKFISLLESLKSQNHSVRIHTNASAKTEKFWQQVCDCLDHKDQIVFAIDGLKDTNHLYRKNSNWQQIMMAVNTVVGCGINTEWQFIVFKQNQHQIQQAQTLSKQLGIKNFRVHKSHRWIDDSLDQYMPDKEYVEEMYFDHQEIVDGVEAKGTMEPMCGMNRETFIDSNGNIFPCCWTATYRFQYKHAFGKQPINIAMGKYQLPQPHSDYIKSTQVWQTAPLVCRLHCAKY